MTTGGMRAAAVGLLLAASTLVGGRPLDVGAVGGLDTVTLSPVHGRAAAPFQVTYAISPCQAAAGLTISFSWGGLAPSGQILGTATTDSACRATLSTTPPVNTATHQPPAPGTYQVFGYVALPTGTAAPNTEASASYSIDVTPTATASAHPSTTAQSPATANASATSNPSASAPGTTAASPPAAAPAASAPAAVEATVGAGNPVVARPAGDAGWWRLSWPVVLVAAVLAIAILAGIAFLIAWIVRRRGGRAAGLRNDKAA